MTITRRSKTTSRTYSYSSSSGQKDEVENYKVLVDARKAYDQLVEESEPALGTWKATDVVTSGNVFTIEELERVSDDGHDPNVTVIMEADNTITLKLGDDLTAYGTWTKEKGLDGKSWDYQLDGFNVSFNLYCTMNDDDPDALYLFMTDDESDDVMYAMERVD